MMDYKKAGVDIEAGYKSVENSILKSTNFKFKLKKNSFNNSLIFKVSCLIKLYSSLVHNFKATAWSSLINGSP